MRRLARWLPLATSLLVATACGDISQPSPVVQDRFLAAASLPAVPNFAVVRDTPLTVLAPRVELSWEDVAGEDAYLIQWRVGEDGAWTTLLTTSRDRTSYVTDSMSFVAPNYYRIAAMTSAFEIGPYSTDLLDPTVVTDDRWVIRPDTTVALLGRGDRNGRPATFYFEVSTDPTFTSSTFVPAMPGSPVSATIPVTLGTTYYYKLLAVAEQDTFYGAPNSLFAGPPEAPALSADFRTSDYSALTSWAHSGEGVFNFQIQRRMLGEAAWIDLSTQPMTMRSFPDARVPVSVSLRYEYRVLACSAIPQCTPSAPDTVRVQVLPAPPSLTATVLASGNVQLSWQAVGASTYLVQWRSSPGAAWKNVLTTAPGATSVVTSRVTAGTTNDYRVTGLVSGYRWGLSSQTSVAVP